MQLLSKVLRDKFDKTITKARAISERAAKAALEQLGVEQPTPYSYLLENQRDLRRRLRSHGRQLGDALDSSNGAQEIDRLIEEIAYEHWHRMLFARFLAENQLLMYYEDDDIQNAVAITLFECEEMAPEMGCQNIWEFAARLAAKMLPQIFRPESPVFELHFSPEDQRELERLLSELDIEVFTASDSLGWAYQFWQSNKKETINKSEVKIGARELPAVTQLFTEPYMVSFLLDNSLGAWWANKRLSKEDFENAESEEELRNMASLPGLPLEYLRFIRDKNGHWLTADGKFEGWPENLSEFKALDPCCGSGHFIVSTFSMLVSIRMELEGLSAKESCNAVIRENIHGLEIDKRCVEIAAFAVAFAAWKYPNSGGYRNLPEMQIAWCGQSVNVKKEEWLALSEGDNILKMHLTELYDLFKDAPVLGSLLNPRSQFETGSMFDKDWKTVKNLLISKLENKRTENNDLGIMAQGMEKAFTLLGDKYHLVMTNVPYLGIRKQEPEIRDFCEKYFKMGRHDLATAFLERCMEFLLDNCVLQAVTPHYWMNLGSYAELRKYFLQHYKWLSVMKLGSGAFETISGEIVNTVLLAITKCLPRENLFIAVDVSDATLIKDKLYCLRCNEIQSISQEQQLMNPDMRIILGDINTTDMLSIYAESLAGIQNGDSPRFQRFFLEIPFLNKRWCLEQMAVTKSIEFGGLDTIIDYDIEEGHLRESKNIRRVKLHDSDQRGKAAWTKKGVLVSRMGNLNCTLYEGNLFDQNAAVILPYSPEDVLPIFLYCSSAEYTQNVRKIDSKINVTNATLVKVPFDIEYWRNIANGEYPNGLPKPYKKNPTQWIFHGHPAQSDAPLQVAVARLLGYRWPAEIDKDMELSDEARELVKKCDKLLPYADEDGIVCIPSVRGEAPAADRLLNLLAAAYEGQDINVKLAELLADCDHAGKSLDSWLRDKFFIQHCKLFGNRPFIWHIWDGLQDGFSVLVNYHKLNRQNLETVVYTYLGDWINKQKAGVSNQIKGADEKLSAALGLKKRLEQILEGENPLDIFIRWKPIYEQPIGWEPDINDGVRLNIRPFLLVDNINKKGAGVLREKPNIKWEKDRGKDTQVSPWYHVFNGDRVNDYHLTLDEKKKARAERRQDKRESS